MKIGITQLITGTMSIAECIELCEEAGYEAFELFFGERSSLSLDMETGELEAIGERFSEAGIEISGITKGSINLLSPDFSEVASGKETLSRLLEIAGILNVDAVLLHPGSLTPEGTYTQAWNRLRGTLEEMVPTAAENGVHICVENVWNKFLLSPREMRHFVDEVGSEWVKVYLDTANMMAYGYPEHWIRELKERIYRVHFKDFSRGDHKFVDLMEGDTDWAVVMEELRNAGYEAPVIHEVGGDREDLIKTAESMREIVAM